jgi:hypothetical protein
MYPIHDEHQNSIALSMWNHPTSDNYQGLLLMNYSTLKFSVSVLPLIPSTLLKTFLTLPVPQIVLPKSTIYPFTLNPNALNIVSCTLPRPWRTPLIISP